MDLLGLFHCSCREQREKCGFVHSHLLPALSFAGVGATGAEENLVTEAAPETTTGNLGRQAGRQAG